MRKKYLVALIALIAMLGASITWSAQASPGDKCYETVVVTDAWVETVNHPAETRTETVTVVVTPAKTEQVFDHWQRYSWTGGNQAENEPPTEVPPSDNWQANVQGDPHGIGTAGLYWQPHGQAERTGAWFYLEAVTKTVTTPAVTRDETRTVVVKEAWTETINHPAVTEEKEVPCPEEPEVPQTPEPETPNPEEKPDPVIKPVPNAPRGHVDRGGQTIADQPVAVPTSVAAGK